MIDENLQDVAVDTDTEVDEATNSNDNGSEETVDYKAKYEEAVTANSQILARAKKAEGELKNLKNSSKDTKPSSNGLSRDEVVLLAKGLSDDEIEMAKKIAAVIDKPMSEAINDPLFTSYKERKEQELKEAQASLGASKGSGGSATKKTFNSVGLSPAEHKKMWKEKFQNS